MLFRSKELANIDSVHAITDVTGFGLLGHAREMALGSKLRAHLQWSSVPLLPQVESLAGQGFITGASGRNWAGYGKDVHLAAEITPTQQALLCDPQTSGGLLLAVSPDRADALVAACRRHGTPAAAVIGRMTDAGPGRVRVRAGA